jgi:hypothetical protein
MMGNMLNNGDVPVNPAARLPVIKAKSIRAVVEPLFDHFPGGGANDRCQNQRHEELACDFQGATHGRLTIAISGAIQPP